MKEYYKVAYIMSRFPGLSETFILREMCEMERLGWNISLYPLIYQQEETVIHDEAKDWLGRVANPILISILKENLKLLVSDPVLYFTVLVRTFWENIKSPKFFSRALIVFPKAVWMASRMSDEGVRYIHSHYATHPALAAWIINQISNIPYGITVHAHDIFVDRTMLRRKILDAKHVICISEYNQKFLVHYYGDWVATKSQIIHCGIEVEKYVRKEKQPVTDKKFEIISIGSLRSYKGFTILIDACNLLKKQYGLNFQCRIVGSGELYNSLQAKITNLNIDDVVELMGPKKQNEIADILLKADCYIQPSVITSTGKMEGIPVSLMEAMASSLPVIASNISGIPELVIHNETGLLVQPEDPIALAETIWSVYNSSDKGSVLAKKGRDFVIREFRLSREVSKLSQLLLDSS